MSTALEVEAVFENPALRDVFLRGPAEEDVLHRMLQLARLSTCEVIRSSSIRDATGGGTTIWSVQGTYIGRLSQNLRPEERGYDDNILSRNQYIFALPRNANVLTKDRIAVPGWLPKWKANTTYSVGQLVIPTNIRQGARHCYKVLSVINLGGDDSAQSTGVEPIWPVEDGAFKQDGLILWQEAGLAVMLEVNGLFDINTGGHETLAHVSEVL